MHSSISVFFNCPNCGNEIKYQQVFLSGNNNDNGSWEVKCLKCENIHIHRVGKGVNNSQLISGGEILKRIAD